ncbi:MAG: HlyD family efflux transporter periplasmic adaptor subunit, partial [candidate division Zixibacteria bacterium]
AGELIAPGKPILRIARLDSVWVKLYLPAADFASVKLGDAVTIDTETGSNRLKGRVIKTADEAEFTPKNVQTKQARADLVYAVKIAIDNSTRHLKIGMPVFVTMDEI